MLCIRRKCTASNDNRRGAARRSDVSETCCYNPNSGSNLCEIRQPNDARYDSASVPLVSASSSLLVVQVSNESELEHGAWLGRCLSDFSAAEYGEEYFSLKRDERVTRSREKLEDQGWAYGRKETNEEGWFPADFWQELPSSRRLAYP